MHGRSTTKVIEHASKHPAYKKQFDELKKGEQKQAEQQQKSMKSFLKKGMFCF
jgi:hypothetical protein